MREGLVEVMRRMKGFAARDDISLESRPLQASFAGDDAPSFGVRALASEAPGMKILGIDGRDDTPVESLRSTLRRAASRRNGDECVPGLSCGRRMHQISPGPKGSAPVISEFDRRRQGIEIGLRAPVAPGGEKMRNPIVAALGMAKPGSIHAKSFAGAPAPGPETGNPIANLRLGADAVYPSFA